MTICEWLRRHPGREEAAETGSGFWADGTYNFDGDGRFVGWVKEPDDPLFNGAPKGGTLYANEKEAYNAMWKHSFSNGKPVTENFAWITNKGVLVLPYESNENDHATTDVYKVYSYKEKSYLEFDDGSVLRIFASVHTHPNGDLQSFSDGDTAFLAQYPSLPMFTIGTNEVWGTRYQPGTPGQLATAHEALIGPRSDLLRGSFLLSTYVNYVNSLH